jgi:hypothetical protein
MNRASSFHRSRTTLINSNWRAGRSTSERRRQRESSTGGRPRDSSRLARPAREWFACRARRPYRSRSQWTMRTGANEFIALGAPSQSAVSTARSICVRRVRALRGPLTSATGSFRHPDGRATTSSRRRLLVQPNGPRVSKLARLSSTLNIGPICAGTLRAGATRPPTRRAGFASRATGTNEFRNPVWANAVEEI